MSNLESNDIYNDVALAGDSFLRQRVKWWDDHRVMVQIGVLLFDMAALLGLITTAMLFPRRSVTVIMVALVIGLLALASVGSISRLYEMVRTDYHARVRIGCRELGGIACMPAAMLHRPGPLRAAAQRLVRDAELDAREEEYLVKLGENWVSSLGELIHAARSLSRLEITHPGHQH